MKNLMKIHLTVIVAYLLFAGCQQPSENKIDLGASDFLLRKLHEGITETIIQDGFSPPVASRIYAYTYIGAYECLAVTGDVRSFNNRLNGLSFKPIKVDSEQYDPGLAIIEAYTKLAKHMVYRDFIIDTFKARLLKKIGIDNFPRKKVNYSFKKGDEIADVIIEWSKSDHYRETRDMPYHPVKDNPSAWEPTPPTYATALEPHWRMIRPFAMDSAAQFKPTPPETFSTDSGSAFYQRAYQVYSTGKNLNEEKRAIARFWNCLPMTTVTEGHLMHAIKQISPGGHWMGIAATIAHDEKLDLAKTAETYALVAIALADGFISAWNEKYRSNLIRPETYINRNIDARWRPLLETPEFPEHTSAHSVISTSAATVLTHLYGDNHTFIDSVEVPFGLPPRTFNSFYDASNEAAISRLYGGIHYMTAIQGGIDQGKGVGTNVLKKLGYL